MSDSNSPSSQSNGSHPSMIGGHAKYLAGAASSLFGNDAGEETKNEAVKEMRAASELSGANAPSNDSSTASTIEQKVGQLVGCEGMEKQGADNSDTTDRVGAQSN